ncbi:MAG: YchJ family protein [Moraxella sp.]|nr:YchJ family protein [Moraxella sp.]
MIDGCPCGSSKSYRDCCQILHDGGVTDTAECLMRARFSAFYFKKVDYIIATTVPYQQDLLNKSALQSWADGMNWTRLDVISHNKVGKRHAQVHFYAYFDDGQGEKVHDELSAFVKADGRWYFLDPTVPVMLTNKQPCLCGSGKKFKACCGRFLL